MVLELSSGTNFVYSLSRAERLCFFHEKYEKSY